MLTVSGIASGQLPGLLCVTTNRKSYLSMTALPFLAEQCGWLEELKTFPNNIVAYHLGVPTLRM
jgi:hypothetical protein